MVTSAAAVVIPQIGARLREARLNARLTVREAAVRAGLRGHGTLVQYENGHVLPPVDRLAALAATYAVPLASLFVSNDSLIPMIMFLEQATPAQLCLLGQLLAQVQAAEPGSGSDRREPDTETTRPGDQTTRRPA